MKRIIFIALLTFVFTGTKAQLQYSSQFGTFGTGNGQFDTPTSIAIDTANSIVYVCDKNNHRIQKFSLTGTFIGTIGSGTSQSTDGNFSYPMAITVDDNANLYVNDAGNQRVQKFNSSGIYQEKWSVPGASDGMAVNGGYYNLYVLDKTNCKVLKVDNYSGIVSEYSNTCGSGNNEYSNPVGIFHDEDQGLFIADAGNNRFQRISYTGTFYQTFGSNGSGDGQYNNPVHIVVNENGIKYVCDAGNNRIQKLDYFSAYVNQFGTAGSGNGQFDYPVCSAIAKDNSLYVVDQNNNRIQIFTESTSGVFNSKSTEVNIIQNNNQFTISKLDHIKSISITDMLGKTEKFNSATFTTSLKGLLILTIQTEENIIQHKSIVD